MTRGGKREPGPGKTIGRPPGPTGKARKMRSMRLTDAEHAQVKQLIKALREKEAIK